MQENLLGLVEQAGVVGAGGAGFPTHVKLKAQADTVIINGAECEPLLRVDQQLMALQAGDLLDALDLLVEQVGASQGVVALKEHYHAAVEALERELSRHPKLRIHRMGAFYPAGDEQVGQQHAALPRLHARVGQHGAHRGGVVRDVLVRPPAAGQARL